MHRSILVSASLMLAQTAQAEGLGSIGLTFEGGNIGGPALSLTEDVAREAESFGLLGLDAMYFWDADGPWAYQGHAQIVSNIRQDDRPIIEDGEPLEDSIQRQDNYMSYWLAEGHAVYERSGLDWGGFAGVWTGELDDGSDDIGNFDEAEKYYLGVEVIGEQGRFDMFAQLAYTDTIGSDFSNVPSEGTDFRQIRDGAFLSVGGNYHASENMVLNGRLSAVVGDSSTANVAIEETDFQGLYAEIGVEYQPRSVPMTLAGGVGYNLSQFPDDTDGEFFGTTNSAYAFVGVTYWFGGGAASDNRRQTLPVRPADFLVAAESAAIGTLN